MRPARRAEERPKLHRASTTVSAAGVSTQQARHSVRRRRRSEGRHGGLRPVAAVSGAEAAAAADCVGFIAAAISDCAALQQVVRRCNGSRCDATGNAAMQLIAMRCNRWRFDATHYAALQRWRCVATDCAAMQQAVLRCNRLRCDAACGAAFGWRQHSACARVCAEAPTRALGLSGKRPN